MHLWWLEWCYSSYDWLHSQSLDAELALWGHIGLMVREKGWQRDSIPDSDMHETGTRQKHQVDEPLLLLNKKKIYLLYSLLVVICIYVAVPETAMCGDRHPTGTLNKLACHTWEVRLNGHTVPEVVSFSCITPSMFCLPFTGHWNRSIKTGKKKYSLGMRF